MRSSVTRWLWWSQVALSCFPNIAHCDVTCPNGSGATSSVNSFVALACSELSAIVSQELKTASIAAATIHVTIPLPSSAGTQSQILLSSTTGSLPSQTTPLTSGSVRGHGRNRGSSTSAAPTRSVTSARPNAVVMHTSISSRTTSSNVQTSTSKSAVPVAGREGQISPSSDHNQYRDHVVIPVSVVCTVVPVLIIVLIIWLLLRRRRRRKDRKAFSSTMHETTDKGLVSNEHLSPVPATAPQLAIPIKPQSPIANPDPSNTPWQVQPLRHFRRQYGEMPTRSPLTTDKQTDADEENGVDGLTALREEDERSGSSYTRASFNVARGTWLDTPQDSNYERRQSSSWLSNASLENDGSPRVAY